MTPATRNFNIYKGAKWSYTFSFLQSGTTTPVNLSGSVPMVFTVKKPNTDETIFNATVTVATPANGVAVVTISGAQSDLLPVGAKVRYGLRDNLNNPYMVGFLEVKYFAPEPV
jgi:hypothetical protein